MSSADLTGLPRVDVADVYKAGIGAATLTRRPDGVAFAYREDYLERSGPPVATTLPLSDAPVITQAGAVPPFFAGLLPEGRRLSALRRAVKTSADDELSLLIAVGQDTVGDVQVVPAGERPQPAEPLLRVQAEWSEVRFADLLADVGIVDRVGLPGVQEKFSAGMIAVPISRSAERFILKVDPPEYPHVVENESFFLAVARAARIEAVSARVVRDAEERAGLLITRFDRIASPDGESRALAVEDACQVLGRWPADKYNLSSEAVVVALADRCAARPVALQNLYRQLCFAWLTGNGDVHAKNLSILATPEGEWRVAPAYDLPSTVPYRDATLALPIGGRTRGLSRRRLLEFASAIGLPQKAAMMVLDELLEHLSDLEERLRAGALPFDSQITTDLVAELRHRRRQASS